MVCCQNLPVTFQNSLKYFSIPVCSFALIMRTLTAFFLYPFVDAMSFRISALFSIRITRIFLLFNCSIHCFSSTRNCRLHKVGNICPFDGFQRTGYAHFSQFPFIIKSGSIDKETRTDMLNFHRFADSICCCTGNIRYKGGVLSVKALIREDLPLLRFPNRTICSRLAAGVLFRLIFYWAN